ncbi:MAG: hypothetical protein ACX932_05840 [Gammaproteobacteria bacterium]
MNLQSTINFLFDTQIAVDTLFSPLKKILPINYLCYSRVYKDASRILLTNNPQWIAYYFNEELYSTPKLTLNTLDTSIILIPWSFFDTQRDLQSKAEQFNIYNCVCIVIKNADSWDVITLGLANREISAVEVYTEKRTIINSFFSYFKCAAKSLINDAIKQKLCLKKERKIML